ncbi:hypothetical protein PIB30_088642 [Stylosanthes scabra]|uniref:Uncharacterized protein n=1 Tax=Stylosanthes scabra TaxID=79078 RepID=A0ABU6XU12_9FABA|nr:hypothetical protein [Stylosanthes scabra]
MPTNILTQGPPVRQVTLTLLKRQPDSSQQKPVKHCGICSFNSHHTDECPQLQEDNTVASTHNFFDAIAIPPYNKQYYTQGWRDGQPTHWNPPQQPQAQPRQPYTYSQPQNSQNPRYQPPHNHQLYPPSNNPSISYGETLRAFQRENQEMREAQKRTESQINHLTEMLQKFTSQQVQPQPPTPSPLPSQPLPNPKGSINIVHDKGINEDEDEDEDFEWLYELLAKLADSNDEEDEESEEESDEEDEDESVEEESEDKFDEEEDETEEEEKEESKDGKGEEDEEEIYNNERRSKKRSLLNAKTLALA